MQPFGADAVEGAAVVVSGSCGKVAVVWGAEPPPLSIGFDEPMGSWDSGFSVIFEDAPEPEDVGDATAHPGISLVCLHCLLDDHPEIGRGLDVAREYGAADLDERGTWVGRRLEPEEGEA